MTNSINKMAGKNAGVNNSASKKAKQRAGKQTSPMASLFGTSPPRFPQQRQSPSSAVLTGRGSPKSPGLSHFAGAKWTDPPAATALPLPPVHWTQQSKPMPAINFCNKSEVTNMGNQLKMLLEGQA